MSIRARIEASGARAHERLSSLVVRPLFWFAVVVVLHVAALSNALRFELPEPLPVIAQLDDFQLTDQYGSPFGSEQLKGKVWVANFIFTRCPTVCPAFTAKMGQVQRRTGGLAPHLHLVSFSVDPEFDTPERLADYARKAGASKTIWRFLTGPLGSVKDVVSGGLKSMMGNDAPDGDFEGIFHGSHFVVIDRDMQIRGFYDANDVDAVDNVVQALGLIQSLDSLGLSAGAS